MRIIGTLVLVLAALFALLRSDITPFRLMSVDELTEMKRSAVEQAYAVNPPGGTHDGAWMWDPKYRTSLEKTTEIGRPDLYKPSNSNGVR